MKVFISWSGEESKHIAEILRNHLTDFFNNSIEFWVSAEDISLGAVTFDVIRNALIESDMAILCLTAMNYNKPWILFESGAIFGKNYFEITKNKTGKTTDNTSIIIPVLFDDVKIENLSSSPLSKMQMCYFKENDIKRALKAINERSMIVNNQKALSDNAFNRFFESIWKQLYDDISAYLHIERRKNMLSVFDVIEQLRLLDYPEPKMGRVIFYNSGFETTIIYRMLMEKVSKRLWVFGRKNSKMFKNENHELFKDMINQKLDCRILFLNPNAEDSIISNAQDINSFKQRLSLSICDTYSFFKDLNCDSSEFCRLYSSQRDFEILIADNVVLYKEIEYNDLNKPEHLTGSSFNIVDITTEIGEYHKNKFLNVWNKSIPLDESFIKKIKTE